MQASGHKGQTIVPYVAVLSIILLTLPFRVSSLSRGLGEDELFTAVNFVEVHSLLKTLGGSGSFNTNNQIGYSVMARSAEAVLGRSEKALRLPALLLGLASIGAMFLFARALMGTGFALFAALALALSPPQVSWSVQARGYSGMIFFSVLSTYLFFRLLKRDNGADAVLFVMTNIAGVYVHLYSVFVIATQLIWVLYVLQHQHITTKAEADLQRRRLVTCFFAIALGSLIVYAPALPSFFDQVVGRGRSTFNPAFPWMVLQYLSGTQSSLFTLLVVTVVATGCVEIYRIYPQVLWYLLLLFLGPLLLMWFIRPFDLYTRFFVYWLPFYILLFVAGIRRAWDGVAANHSKPIRYGFQLVAAVVLVAVILHWTVTWKNWIPDEGYREVSRAAELGADPAAAFCAIGGSRTIWKYYISKPIAIPLSMADFQQLASTHPEVRCFYYEAPYQDAEQTRIAQFLFQRAYWSQWKGHTWFVYRSDSKAVHR